MAVFFVSISVLHCGYKNEATYYVYWGTKYLPFSTWANKVYKISVNTTYQAQVSFFIRPKYRYFETSDFDLVMGGHDVVCVGNIGSQNDLHIGWEWRRQPIHRLGEKIID